MIAPDFVRNPHIRLFGNIDDLMVNNFLTQLDRACGDDHCARTKEGQRQVVVEVSSSGGTADNAYRIFEEIRLAREHQGIDFLFLGKTFLYSAGVTLMAAFPRNKRSQHRHCRCRGRARCASRDTAARAMTKMMLSFAIQCGFNGTSSPIGGGLRQ